jgi:amidase
VDEFAGLDAVAQAELVTTGQVHPVDLVTAAIRRIEAVNPLINAVVTSTFDRAVDAAASVPRDRVLAGVPFLAKDFIIEWAGVRFTDGMAAAGEYISPCDQELASRYDRAGLILCGKTNTPELGLEMTTEPARFGPTRNPWDLTRSAGGSSGGSAAAVAAGLVPLAHGNDGGGSLRQPAAWCGLFGLKPTRGRNPLGPRYGDVLVGMCAEHVLTRTVRDSALALDATHGPQPGDPYEIPPPRGCFRDAVERDPRRLRIALSTRSFNCSVVDRQCAAAAFEAAEICAGMGHDVAEASPTFDREEFQLTVAGLFSAATAWALLDWNDRLDRAIDASELGPIAQSVLERGRRLSAADHLRNVERMQRISRDVGRFFLDFDVLLTPSTAAPSHPLGAVGRATTFERTQRSLAFTALANLTGQPAMSVPMSHDDHGMPRGAQFIAPFGDEVTLFELAGQLECAVPWAHRRPTLASRVTAPL